MVALASYRYFTQTHTQALVFQKLDALFRSTRLVINGTEWTAPTLDRIASQIGVHKATVSRAIQWLKEQGFIMVRASRWCRSPRLYVRVLCRFRDPAPDPVQRESNVSRCAAQPVTLHHATCNHIENNLEIDKEDTGPAFAGSGVSERDIMADDSPDTPSHTPPAPRALPRKTLGSSVASVGDRLAGRKATAPVTKGTLPLAQRWNAALKAHGHPGFTTDTKALSHVKNAVARFAAAGLDLHDHLETVIFDWPDFAPIKAGKVPLPWAVIRAAENYFTLVASRKAYAASGSQAPQEAPVAPPAPTPAPTPHVASAPPPAPSKGGLMHKLAWIAGKPATPPGNVSSDTVQAGPDMLPNTQPAPAKQPTIAELLAAGVAKSKAGKT